MDDSRQGHGEEISAEGSKFVGMFENDVAVGESEVKEELPEKEKIMQQGDAFDEENFFKVERTDGSVYEGPLDNKNEPHGKGVETRNNGEYEYQGDWVHGEKEGQGLERDTLKGEEYVG